MPAIALLTGPRHHDEVQPQCANSCTYQSSSSSVHGGAHEVAEWPLNRHKVKTITCCTCIISQRPAAVALFYLRHESSPLGMRRQWDTKSSILLNFFLLETLHSFQYWSQIVHEMAQEIIIRSTKTISAVGEQLWFRRRVQPLHYADTFAVLSWTYDGRR